MKITSLDKLKAGEKGKVISVNLTGKIKYRLLDMGIVKNTIIEMTKKAPLGDPIQIFIKGYSLSIRKKIAEKIEVEVTS